MKRILVADDSVTIQKVIALTFADEPYEVQSVGTGAEALEIIKTWKPDILLADVIMPQMNGYELSRAVKGKPETASMPVLLLAGTFEAFDEEEARSVGADDFITKPFESAELIEKVNTLTGGAPAEVPAEAPQTEAPQAAPVSAPAPERLSRATSAPVEGPPSTAGHEPDIWDILSDTEGGVQLPDDGASGAPVPGLGSLEDQGVIDVGSFDVGLDRPEQAPVPSEPRSQAAAEASPASPVEPPVSREPIKPPNGESVELGPEKSRVEDREKDFFGFETEGFEAATGTDLLGDAVEEITFDMEKVAVPGEEADQEASFVVPEPAEADLAVTGKTVSPEIMAPEGSGPARGEEPPLSIPKELLEEVIPDSVAERVVTSVSGTQTAPVPEIPLHDQVPEIKPQPEPPLELEREQTPKPSLDTAIGPREADVKKIIEEKVEKIAWEVVPEMAEILIREALEKIKGGS